MDSYGPVENHVCVITSTFWRKENYTRCVWWSRREHPLSRAQLAGRLGPAGIDRCARNSQSAEAACRCKSDQKKIFLRKDLTED